MPNSNLHSFVSLTNFVVHNARLLVLSSFKFQDKQLDIVHDKINERNESI